MRRTVLLLAAFAILAVISPTPVLGEDCFAPDNGTGTIDYPPDCPFDGEEPMLIIDGLPPGSTIELHGPIENFYDVQNFPGGTLGGEVCLFYADITWELIGTGDLEGFTRHIMFPVQGEIHIGPRNPGDSIQSFDQEMFRMVGQMIGDPDFDELNLIAGVDLGLPCPGQATLTELPSGDFAVDSFFDITYRIDFVGAPGSMLEGMAGSTIDTVRRQTEYFLFGCCTAPDNGTGTVDFPADCPYFGPEPMMIIDGLPAGSSIELEGPMESFYNVVNTPGGTLGGEICTFNAQFTWILTGTGALAGYMRSIIMPVQGEMHIGPRNPGDPLQTFDADLFQLNGLIFGDPDFEGLSVIAGTDYGFPCPGSAILSLLDDGDFVVDSFFDITYRIEFIGAPGGPLDGMSGVTEGSVFRETCAASSDAPDLPADSEIVTKLLLAPNAPNPFGRLTRIDYAIPQSPNDDAVALKVYDMSGRLIRTLVDHVQPAGIYSTSWDGHDRAGKPVGGGIYFYQLQVGKKKLSGRMVMLK